VIDGRLIGLNVGFALLAFEASDLISEELDLLCEETDLLRLGLDEVE
jgi:hypothetical protein